MTITSHMGNRRLTSLKAEREMSLCFLHSAPSEPEGKFSGDDDAITYPLETHQQYYGHTHVKHCKFEDLFRMFLNGQM